MAKILTFAETGRKRTVSGAWGEGWGQKLWKIPLSFHCPRPNLLCLESRCSIFSKAPQVAIKCGQNCDPQDQVTFDSL